MATFVKAVKSGVGWINRKISGEYKMLLIGETGSGKTSFLNLMCNYGKIQTLGKQVNIADFKEFHDIKLENSLSCKMESKTNGATLYKIEFDTVTIGIIDTPGFGDSRGLDVDKQHVIKIIDALKTESYINCVCLVINGRSSRMSATLRYVLSEITAILPREVLNNVIIIFTHTADPLDLNIEPNVLAEYLGKNIENYFCIENPYCRIEKANAKRDKLSIDKIARSLQKSFDETSQTLDLMSDTIKDFKKVYTSQFTKLYETRQAIENKLIKLLVAYDNQTRSEQAIKKAQEEVEAALKTKYLNKDFRSTQKIQRVITKDTPSPNTLCGEKNCYSNCHTPCYLDKSFDKESFKSCAAIGPGNYCNICGHHYRSHYNNEVIFEKVTEVIEFVDENMKRQFEKAESNEEIAESLRKKFDSQRESSENERKKLSIELLSVIDEFQKLGISRNYVKILEDQLFVIQQRLEGEIGENTADLRHSKDEIEKKMVLVNKALTEPWSADSDLVAIKEWAYRILEFQETIELTNEIIDNEFKELTLKHHPDHGGAEDLYKRITKARDILKEIMKV